MANVLVECGLPDVLINIIDIFKDYIPHVITSDSDLTFMSNKIQELFNKYDIYHDVIIEH